MEVDQEPGWLAGQLQVRQQLGVVHWSQLADGLQFNHNAILDEQVEPETGVDYLTLEDYRDRKLGLDLESALLKYVSKADSVGVLEQSRAQKCVDAECGVDDLACYAFVVHNQLLGEQPSPDRHATLFEAGIASVTAVNSVLKVFSRA